MVKNVVNKTRVAKTHEPIFLVFIKSILKRVSRLEFGVLIFRINKVYDYLVVRKKIKFLKIFYLFIFTQ